MQVSFQNALNVTSQQLARVQNLTIIEGVSLSLGTAILCDLVVDLTKAVLTTRKLVLLTAISLFPIALSLIVYVWKKYHSIENQLPPAIEPPPPAEFEPIVHERPDLSHITTWHDLVNFEEPLDTEDVYDFVRRYPGADINALNQNGKTSLNAAIWKRPPCKALIIELLRREAHFSPGSAVISLNDFRRFFENASTPGVAALAILEAYPNNEEILNYLEELAKTNNHGLSRIAAQVVLDFYENATANARGYAMRLQLLNAMPEMIRIEDPIGIMVNYLDEIPQAVDIADENQIRTNLQALRIEAGLESYQSMTQATALLLAQRRALNHLRLNPHLIAALRNRINLDLNMINQMRNFLNNLFTRLFGR